MLEMTLERLPADDPTRALVLAALCAELSIGTSLERRQALADEAIHIAESSGDDATIVRVLNLIHVPLHVPVLLKDGLARTQDALIRAERVGDPVLLFFAAGFRADTVARLGDIDEMNRCIELQASMAERLDQLPLHWLNIWLRGMQAQIAGDTDRAEQLATQALQVGTDGGQSDAATFFGAQLIIVSFQRGTLGEMVPLIEQLEAQTPDLAPPLTAILALAHAEADRTQEARHLLERFAATDFTLSVDALWISSMVCYAEAAIECRDPHYAEPLFDRLAPWADLLSTSGGATSEGPVGHYLGGLATVLGRYDEANTYLARSAAFSDRLGAKFFAARTNLSWGRMLLERAAAGDADHARDLLAQAHTAAVAHGYANVERRATEALRHLV